MKLIGDKILCKPLAPDEVTASGIIIPVARKKQNDFEVIKVSQGVKHIKVGDIVRKFSGSDGKKLLINEVNHLILSEKDDIDVII